MDRKGKRLLHIVLSIILVVTGVIVMGALTAGKSRIEKVETTTPAPMVRVMEISREPRIITIRAFITQNDVLTSFWV